MPSRLDRHRIILAKIQPTQGTDAVPTGAANAVLLAGIPKVTPFKASNENRDLIRNYFGASEQLVGAGYVELAFSVEFQSGGSGIGASAAPWGALARGAGWNETLLAAAVTGTAQSGSTSSTLKLAAGASVTDDFYNGMRVSLTGGTGSGQSALILDYDGTTKVATVGPAWSVTPDATSTYSIDANAAYAPISESQEMLSIYYYRSGVLRKAIDCRGAIETVDCGVGKRPLFNFRMLGIDAGVSAASNPAQTLTGWKVPEVINDPNTGDILLGGSAYPSRGFTINGGNQVGYTPLLGGEAIDITGRQITGRTDLSLTAAQVATFHSTVRNNTLQSFGFLHGTAAGKRMSITGPAVQLLDQEETETNGRALDGYSMRFLPVNGNDELRIVAM
jgi:hypothetical protein